MEIIVAAVFIVFLVVAALYVSMQKKDVGEEEKMPVIHTSGIYSVIRKSPRENVAGAKPDSREVSVFLAGLDRDAAGNSLAAEDKAALEKDFADRLEKSLADIEEGDRRGVQRFLILAAQRDLPCNHLQGGRFFITREDIFRHPELIPPYFPGCGCTLISEAEWKTAMEIEHFKPGENERYRLPAWQNALKI